MFWNYILSLFCLAVAAGDQNHEKLLVESSSYLASMRGYLSVMLEAIQRPTQVTIMATTYRPTAIVSTSSVLSTNTSFNASVLSTNFSMLSPNSSVPSTNSSVPSTNSSVPSTNSSVPFINFSVPFNNSLASFTNSSISSAPSTNSTGPSASSSVLSTNSSLRSSNASVNFTNFSLPSSNSSVPSTNSSLPTTNLSMPSNDTSAASIRFSTNASVPSSDASVQPAFTSTVPTTNYAVPSSYNASALLPNGSWEATPALSTSTLPPQPSGNLSAAAIDPAAAQPSSLVSFSNATSLPAGSNSAGARASSPAESFIMNASNWFLNASVPSQPTANQSVPLQNRPRDLAFLQSPSNIVSGNLSALAATTAAAIAAVSSMATATAIVPNIAASGAASELTNAITQQSLLLPPQLPSTQIAPPPSGSSLLPASLGAVDSAASPAGGGSAQPASASPAPSVLAAPQPLTAPEVIPMAAMQEGGLADRLINAPAQGAGLSVQDLVGGLNKITERMAAINRQKRETVCQTVDPRHTTANTVPATAEPAQEFISCALGSWQASRPDPAQLGQAEGLARRLQQAVLARPELWAAEEQFRAWLLHTRELLDIKADEIERQLSRSGLSLSSPFFIGLMVGSGLSILLLLVGFYLALRRASPRHRSAAVTCHMPPTPSTRLERNLTDREVKESRLSRKFSESEPRVSGFANESFMAETSLDSEAGDQAYLRYKQSFRSFGHVRAAPPPPAPPPPPLAASSSSAAAASMDLDLPAPVEEDDEDNDDICSSLTLPSPVREEEEEEPERQRQVHTGPLTRKETERLRHYDYLLEDPDLRLNRF